MTRTAVRADAVFRRSIYDLPDDRTKTSGERSGLVAKLNGASRGSKRSQNEIAQAEVHRRTEVDRRGGNDSDRCSPGADSRYARRRRRFPRSIAHGDAAFEIGVDIGSDAARHRTRVQRPCDVFRSTLNGNSFSIRIGRPTARRGFLSCLSRRRSGTVHFETCAPPLSSDVSISIASSMQLLVQRQTASSRYVSIISSSASFRFQRHFIQETCLA